MWLTHQQWISRMTIRQEYLLKSRWLHQMKSICDPKKPDRQIWISIQSQHPEGPPTARNVNWSDSVTWADAKYRQLCENNYTMSKILPKFKNFIFRWPCFKQIKFFWRDIFILGARLYAKSCNLNLDSNITNEKYKKKLKCKSKTYAR